MTRATTNGSMDTGERTALLDGQARDSDLHVGHHHEPIWVRMPKLAAHLTWTILTKDYVNLLLIFVPLGIVAGALHWDSSAIFALNFIAIIPLASLLSFATEELAATMGQALGGLMNATFGNAVELIVSSLRLWWLVLANSGGR